MKLYYRPEIDGLRAVAVIPVILFHVGFDVFSGGYSGVDVFFVISGYLITSIIYNEFIESKFSITRFYERRARRILPLLFFVLLVTIPFAWVSLHKTDMIDYFESLIAVPLFSSNFLFVGEANYFDTSVDLKPLLHTWSLAVEEQYYILFPLFIMAFFSFMGKRKILPVLTLICLLSFVLAQWASEFYPKHNFYLLPTRSWELAVGAIIGILIIEKNAILIRLKSQKNVSEILSILGLALIISGVFIIEKETPFPNYYALFPVVGTAFVIAFAKKEGFTGAILSARPMIFIGLISYSAYMLHHPLFAFAKHLSMPVQTFQERAVLCLAVIPLAFLSWKFIENPFRNKQKVSRKFIFRFSLIGSVFFVLIGIVGLKNDGFPDRHICKAYLVRNYEPDNRKLRSESWKLLNQAKVELENLAIAPEGGTILYLSNAVSWFDPENNLPNMLLIGNSHSKDLYNVLMASSSAKENFEIGQINTAIRDCKSRDHPLFSSPSYQDADIIVIASRYNHEDIANMERLMELLVADNKTVIAVREIHNFSNVNEKTKSDLMVQESIRQGNNLDNDEVVSELVLEIDRAYYTDHNTTSNERKRLSDKTIDDLLVNYPQIIVLDRMDYVCDNDDKRCFAININLEKYFYDYGHHTLEGAKFFGGKVDKVAWLNPILSGNVD